MAAKKQVLQNHQKAHSCIFTLYFLKFPQHKKVQVIIYLTKHKQISTWKQKEAEDKKKKKRKGIHKKLFRSHMYHALKYMYVLAVFFKWDKPSEPNPIFYFLFQFVSVLYKSPKPNSIFIKLFKMMGHQQLNLLNVWYV